MPTSSRPSLHRGSCHCGRVTFAAQLDVSQATRCNCSICTKLSTTGGLIKPEAFELLTGMDALSSYRWSYRGQPPVGERFFCRHCGVHCFGRGELDFLGGAFVSINVNTLDDVEHGALTPAHWDGRHDNWMAGARAEPWPTGLGARAACA